MMDFEEKLAQAKEYSASGLQRVKTTPQPAGQKFPIGSRVKIADDLGATMRHFPAGLSATVLHTYAHAYGGDDVNSYALNVDGFGHIAWYYENQLTAIGSVTEQLIKIDAAGKNFIEAIAFAEDVFDEEHRDKLGAIVAGVMVITLSKNNSVIEALFQAIVRYNHMLDQMNNTN